MILVKQSKSKHRQFIDCSIWVQNINHQKYLYQQKQTEPTYYVFSQRSTVLRNQNYFIQALNFSQHCCALFMCSLHFDRNKYNAPKLMSLFLKIENWKSCQLSLLYELFFRKMQPDKSRRNCIAFFLCKCSQYFPKKFTLKNTQLTLGWVNKKMVVSK